MGGMNLLLSALLLAAQGPAPAPAEPPDPRSVAGFAAYLQEDLPQRFDGYRMVAARAEGDVLVVTLDGRRGWRNADTNTAHATSILRAFCGTDIRAAVHMAGVRVDTLERGADLIEGTPVTECPAADAAR